MASFKPISDGDAISTYVVPGSSLLVWTMVITKIMRVTELQLKPLNLQNR